MTKIWWAEGVEGVKRVSVQKARESTSWQAPVYTDGAALWINHKKFLSLSKLALLQERTWSSSPRSLSLRPRKTQAAGQVRQASMVPRIYQPPSHAPMAPGKEQTDQRHGTTRTTLSLFNSEHTKKLKVWMRVLLCAGVVVCTFHRSSSCLISRHTPGTGLCFLGSIDERWKSAAQVDAYNDIGLRYS